jgi:DNA-binding NtrC family response regulator
VSVQVPSTAMTPTRDALIDGLEARRLLIEHHEAAGDHDGLQISIRGTLVEAITYLIERKKVLMAASAVDGASLKLKLADVERLVILSSLKANKGHKRLTSTELGISLKTLYNKLHSYGAMAQSGSE